MTNSWAMLYDHLYGSSDEEMGYGVGQSISAPMGEDVITFNIPNPTTKRVVITDNKDNTFWKYNEGKILREVEEYLSGTYKGHYVGGDNKIQTLDLIDSNGDAEAFCRANIIKYASRFGKKDGKNPKDLLKVIHYAFLLYHFADLPFTEDAVETFSPTGR